MNSDKTVWFAALYCDWIVFCLLIHSNALLNKVNKDPVYQTDLNFLKRLNSFEKDFEIQFTPSLVFQPKLFLTNTNAINLTKNLVHHSKTKHIEIRHHFIREQVSNGVCEIKFIESEKQLADFFTKPLAKDRFNYLRTKLGILDILNIA